MANPTIRFKRGTQSAFGSVGLNTGEPAFITDEQNFYIGADGTTGNNRFFGSSRYWVKENATNSLQVVLVNKDGSASNSIRLKTPDAHTGITTYTLPSTPTNNYYLKTDGSGNLSWAEVLASINIAADTGSVDSVSTGSTITFVGGTNVNTAVTDDTITINLDNNIDVSSLNVSGITTLAGNITLGDNTSDDITVGGEFVSSLNPSTTNSYDLGTSSQRWRNVWVSGNLNVAGVITSSYFNDLLINNKDIVLAYTNGTSETDDTANHGGVAVASTEGSPLIDINVAGINTLPSTYKQIMWVKNGTFTGLATDVWMFNYGVAIGTTTMANGVRLAVGTGVTISDTSVSATNFYGTFSGNSSSADQVKTVTASDTNATYHITFVDSNNGSATNETVYTDDGIFYNPGTNTFTTQHALFTGNVTVQGTLTGTATTATRATTVDTVQNSTNASFYPTFVNSDNATATAESVYTDAGISYNPSSNTLTVGSLVFDGGGAITGVASTAKTIETVQNSTNASFYLTFVDSDNATPIAESIYTDAGISYNPSTNTLTVANLAVDGTTTQVNTTTLTVEDNLIELAKVDGSAPGSDVNKDVGVLLHYYDTAARLGAVYWDDSVSRIVLASRVGESSGVLTVDSGYYAPVEIGSLWVTDCAGTSQVISCTGTERFLENITVDGGTF